MSEEKSRPCRRCGRRHISLAMLTLEAKQALADGFKTIYAVEMASWPEAPRLSEMSQAYLRDLVPELLTPLVMEHWAAICRGRFSGLHEDIHLMRREWARRNPLLPWRTEYALKYYRSEECQRTIMSERAKACGQDLGQEFVAMVDRWIEEEDRKILEEEPL